MTYYQKIANLDLMGAVDENMENAQEQWLRASNAPGLAQNALFSDIMSLLGQAVLCHKVKAYVAASIMCRSTLEAMLFFLIFYRPKEKFFEFDLRLWKNVNGKDSKHRHGLKGLIKWVHKNGIIDSKQREKANKIKEMGDFSAHLAERIGKPQPIKHVKKPTQLWITEKESNRVISYTVDLFICLSSEKSRARAEKAAEMARSEVEEQNVMNSVSWIKLNELQWQAKELKNKSGVYILKWVRNGEHVEIGRIGGKDREGILYIGVAKRNLEERVSKLRRGILEKKSSGHTATMSFIYSSLYDLIKNPHEELGIAWVEHDNAKLQEGHALKYYADKFKELPPLNLMAERETFASVGILRKGGKSKVAGKLDEKIKALIDC